MIDRASVSAQSGASPAPCLYVGDVMHARLAPMSHRFRYRVMSMLLDLDRLDEADRCSPLFGVNRRAVYSFHERDHGDRDGRPLRDFARRHAKASGIDLEGGRIELLCYPRLLGYAFNPLSVYFCHDAAGRLVLLLYEVRNTFGELHCYPVPVRDEQRSPAGIRQRQEKAFYVSPFIAMAACYHFRVSPPAAAVKLRILETDAQGPLLSATFHGSRRPLATAPLTQSLLSLPLVTFKIIAAIHWEALRLWLKGARLMPRPSGIHGVAAQGAASRVLQRNRADETLVRKI